MVDWFSPTGFRYGQGCALHWGAKLKHDELLKLEKKLKAEYLENLAALDDPHDCSLSNMAFYEKKLKEIEAEAQKHMKEVCEESKTAWKGAEHLWDSGCHAHDFNPEHWIFERKITEKMQTNDYTKRFWGYFARDGDPMVDMEEPSFYWVETLADLKKAFMFYDAYRQTFIYKDLVFVNQTVGGGWEAWTLKRFDMDLISFESISMQDIIENGKTHDGLTFEQYIEQLQAMTREQCKNYLQNCLKTK